MSTAVAAARPVRARTRGPVELILEVTLGLFFVALFSWFVGLLIEIAGTYTLWKDEGVNHARRMVAQDLVYISDSPRSLLIDDTRALADRIVVLSLGHIVYDGAAKHLAADELWGLMASGIPLATQA